MEAQSNPPISFSAQTQEPPKTKHFSKTILGIILIALIVGASIGFAIGFIVLDGKINTLQKQLNGGVQGGTYVSYPNATYFVGDNVSLSSLYQQVKGSVVVIQDLVPAYNFFGQLAGYSLQQGSGFVASVENQTSYSYQQPCNPKCNQRDCYFLRW